MTSHRFTKLTQFSKWFLAQPFGVLRPPQNSVYFYETSGGIVISTVLCRMGQFQVELFAGPGPGHFPEHRHPNVDSIEVHLTGETNFTIRGCPVVPPERLAQVGDDGASIFCGFRSRVRPQDAHGATVGPAGGAFLSIQHWLNGVEPTSVGLDWEGPAHVQVNGDPSTNRAEVSQISLSRIEKPLRLSKIARDAEPPMCNADD